MREANYGWRPTGRWWTRRVLSAIFTTAFAGLVLAMITGVVDQDRIPALLSRLDEHHIGPLPGAFAVFLGLFAVVAISAAIPRKLRRATTILGTARGWRPSTEAAALVTQWSIAPFGRGSDRKTQDCMSGGIGRFHAMTFTYRYTTGSGEDRKTHLEYVVAVELPGRLPNLRVGPESLLGAIAPGLTRMTSRVENEEFNRLWRVQAGQPAYAVAVLNPRAVEALLQVEPFAWHIEGNHLVAAGTPRPAAELAARLDALVAIAANLPGHLRT
jgi:hypothetical protein